MVYVTHDQIEAMTLGQRIVVFDKGVIQQIDTPMNLYTKPANLFVAGFLGSPAMNFFRGTLHADGAFRLDCGATQLPLGDAPATALRAHAGKPVVVGIRPEDLKPAASIDLPSLQATLEIVEPVGNEMFVNLAHGGAEIVMRTPPCALPPPGSVMTLSYAPAALHFFDGGTGERL
jgi:multiple sugar transport system ATP-binding protein